MPAVSNLLFDWEVDAQRHRMYHLSKPAGVWESWESAVLAWRRVVTVDDVDMRFVGAEETDILVDTVIELDELQDREGER